MYILASTSNSVLSIDMLSKKVITVHKNFGLYYGIERYKGSFAVAARRGFTSSHAEIENERGCICFFGNESPNIWEPSLCLRDLHGIANVQGKLWCTCSFDNGIAILGDDSCRMIYPLGRPTHPPFDVNHINTLRLVGEKLYIVAHNNGSSEVYTLDVISEQVESCVSLGLHAHNVWFDDDEIRVCSSGESDIVGLNGFRRSLHGFPRGHVKIGTNHIIGISEIQARDLRDMTMGMLITTDSEYKEVDRLELGRVGMVLDAIEISQKEYEALIEFAD